MCCASPSSAATLNIEEVNIQPTNWAAVVISGSSLATTSVQLGQGSPVVNHSALGIVISNSALTTFTFDVAVYKKDQAWNPATMGPIVNVSYSADIVMNPSVTFAPILFQNGNVYAPANAFFIQPVQTGVPQGIGNSLGIAEFGKSYGPGPAHPDFSPGASLIMTGVGIRRGAFGGGASIRLANYHATLTGIPEPSSWAVVATAVCFLPYWRRFQRRRFT